MVNVAVAHMNRLSKIPLGGSISTGLSDIELVIRAAHRALLDASSTADVSPRKVNKVVRRFFLALKRSHLTFHEFLSDRANQLWMQGDPIMLRTISYLDPTGDTAARRADRDAERKRKTTKAVPRELLS